MLTRSKERALRFALVNALPQLRYFANPRYLKPYFASILARHFPGAYSAVFPGVPLCRQPEYCAWLLRHYPRGKDLERMAEETSRFSRKPLISIITPAYNTDERQLSAAIDSVLLQIYPHWELCIVDDASPSPRVRNLLASYASRDPRIKVAHHAVNRGISAASNTAISLSSGEYVAQLDHDDILVPHALWSVAALLNERPEADIIYSDEDKIDERGTVCDPFFKQDWCPDTFLSKMYTCHFGVYRRSLIEQIGGFRPEFDGAEDYDLVLRLSEVAAEIAHIPDVLYHWRIHPGSIAYGPGAAKAAQLDDAGRRAVQNALDRRGEAGTVESVADLSGHYQVRYRIKGPKTIRIIVPLEVDHRNAPLPRLPETITASASDVLYVYPASASSFLTVVGETGAERRLSAAELFNSAAAFTAVLSESLISLSPDWAERLIEQAQRPAIGVAGALAVGCDGRVIHGGVVFGPRGGFAGSHRDAPCAAPGYFGQLQTTTNYSALGHACVMFQTPLSATAGGPDLRLRPDLAIADFCLRLREAGLHNVCVPQVVAELCHPPPPQTAAEASLFADRWGSVIARDPCYNPHLSLKNADYRLKVHDR